MRFENFRFHPLDFFRLTPIGCRTTRLRFSQLQIYLSDSSKVSRVSVAFQLRSHLVRSGDLDQACQAIYTNSTLHELYLPLFFFSLSPK